MKRLQTEVVNTKYGHVLINKNDIYIGRHLKQKGTWCDEELITIGSVLRTGDVVIEVGSNIGSHSIAIAAKIGSEGKLYAFEPQRIIFYHLAASIALNGLLNVYCYQKAVGAACGFAKIPQVNYEVEGNFGAVSLIEGKNLEVMVSDTIFEEVEVVTIDSLNLPSCRLIKIDAEGMEIDVINGAKDTIKKFRPVIFTEWDARNNDVNIVSKILNLEYKMYAIHTPGNYNLFCIPREWNTKVIGGNEVAIDQNGEVFINPSTSA